LPSPTVSSATTLKRAFHSWLLCRPIRCARRRAPQDLTLRHRVKDYCVGDLERRYVKLGIEEDFFVTYGFVVRSLQL